MTFKDIIYMSSTAWNKISQTTIINCQNKGLRAEAPEPQPRTSRRRRGYFHGFTAEVAEAEKKFADYQDGLPFTTLMKQCAEINEAPVTQPSLTDEEIQKATENPAVPTDLTAPDKEDDPIPEEEPGVPRNCITLTQAVQYTEQLLHWAEYHNLGICKMLQIRT